MSAHTRQISRSEALNLFGGSIPEMAKFFGISRHAIYQWGDFVPPLRAYELREAFSERLEQNKRKRVSK